MATARGFHKYHYVPLQDLQPQNWVLACICVNPVQTRAMVMIQSLHPISIQHFCAYNLLTRPFVNLEDASDRRGRVAPESIYALRSGRSFIQFLKGIVVFRSSIFFLLQPDFFMHQILS